MPLSPSNPTHHACRLHRCHLMSDPTSSTILLSISSGSTCSLFPSLVSSSTVVASSFPPPPPSSIPKCTSDVSLSSVYGSVPSFGLAYPTVPGFSRLYLLLTPTQLLATVCPTPFLSLRRRRLFHPLSAPPHLGLPRHRLI